MKVIFRCDASLQIGTGHIMRCLTLANALSLNGHHCAFVCKNHQGNLIEKIKQDRHTAYTLVVNKDYDSSKDNLAHSKWLGSSQDDDAIQCQQLLSDKIVDWLIVDHYALDSKWENKLRPFTKKIMVIDDLADRQHDCDLLLDQNLGVQAAGYQYLVPKHCQLLMGTKYALLRPEFAQSRDYSLNRRQSKPQLKTLLINLGGVDKANYTTQILQALVNSSLPTDCKIQVIMGATAPHVESVKNVTNELPWQTETIVNADNMAELMANADLAIGASGSTTWERCCLGLPSIQMVTADNQVKVASYLQVHKIAFVMHNDGIESQLTKIIENIVKTHQHLLEISHKCSTITDGLGAVRISKTLME